MFTGIVEAVGRLTAIADVDGGRQVQVRAPVAAEMNAGDSISVSGVCLTVTRREGDVIHADIGPETLRVTTLGTKREGDEVNLERPLRLDGRLGGHLVLGHVDGIGRLTEIRADGESHWLTIEYPDALAPLLIHKGSIAVDGVSLTIADLAPRHFVVQIIPFTWTATTLGRALVGSSVNLECDMIGKYVVRARSLTEHK
jgi:riboflavin synthase